MLGFTCRGALALALAVLCFGCTAGSAVAAEEPYEFNPLASLAGDCSKTSFDPVPDPSCPGGPLPPGGRFDEPTSVAVDFYGNEYVASWDGGTGGRIDIFDDEGRFISELDDPQGPKSLAVDSDGNLYAIEQSPGTDADLVLYTPTVYKPEEGEIAYGNARVVIETVGTSFAEVTIDAKTDRVFVSWGGSSIEEYGSLAEENKHLATITDEKLHTGLQVAVDAERRRLYASSCNNGLFECVVLVF